MMYSEVEAPESVQPFMNPFAMYNTPQYKNAKKKCVLMFTPPMEKGTCILGMPFMRNYYTVFDRKARTVSTALHDGTCNMHGEKKQETSFWKGLGFDKLGLHEERKARPRMQLRKIDVSKLQFSSGFR